MIAVDTNVLIYAHRHEFAQHQSALIALRSLADGRDLWAIPSLCLGEFLRVATHPRILRPPSSVAQATGALQAVLEAPSLRVLTAGERHPELLLRLVRDYQATGNLVFDAQIVALCLEHGVHELLTADRDFDRFREISTRAL